jgi:hypothetical protein
MATKNTKIFHFKTLYTIWQPFWAVVLFEQILKITKVSQILGLLLFHRTSFVLILTKNWVGPHFRRFLHKRIWSGHRDVKLSTPVLKLISIIQFHGKIFTLIFKL